MLPTADRGYSGVMRSMVSHRLGRFCVMLGMALMLVFAGASIANAIDDVQHGTAIVANHQHMPFSSISIEADDTHHDADHHAPAQPDSDGAAEHPAGHHHHGDHGSGLLADLDRGSAAPFINALRPVILSDHDSAGFAVLGLERPPKTSLLDA